MSAWKVFWHPAYFMVVDEVVGIDTIDGTDCTATDPGMALVDNPIVSVLVVC
jgi:hypothetical protein